MDQPVYPPASPVGPQGDPMYMYYGPDGRPIIVNQPVYQERMEIDYSNKRLTPHPGGAIGLHVIEFYK